MTSTNEKLQNTFKKGLRSIIQKNKRKKCEKQKTENAKEEMNQKKKKREEKQTDNITFFAVGSFSFIEYNISDVI